MLPDTLNDHDQIHQKVLNEYSNSKLKQKYIFTSEIIVDIITRTKIRTDVPNKFKECMIDIQTKKVKTSLAFCEIIYIYILTTLIIYTLYLFNQVCHFANKNVYLFRYIIFLIHIVHSVQQYIQ